MLLSTIIQLIESSALTGADARQTSMMFLLNRAKNNWSKSLPTTQKLLSCTSDGLWLLHVEKHRKDMPKWRDGYDFLVQAVMKIHREFEVVGGILPTVSVAAHNIATLLPAITQKFTTSCDSDDDSAEEEEDDDDDEEEEETDSEGDDEFVTPDGDVFNNSQLRSNFNNLLKKKKLLTCAKYKFPEFGIGTHLHPQRMVMKNGELLAHSGLSFGRQATVDLSKRKAIKKWFTTTIRNKSYTFIQVAKTDKLRRAFWICPELGAQCQAFLDCRMNTMTSAKTDMTQLRRGTYNSPARAAPVVRAAAQQH